MTGAEIALPTYINVRRELEIARHTADEVFADVDVLVAPTAMTGPRPIAAAASGALKDVGLIRNTVPFNVRGIPAVSVPCGIMREGLPIGLQIAGPRLKESRVLALAHAYEQATDWHLRRPPNT